MRRRNDLIYTFGLKIWFRFETTILQTGSAKISKIPVILCAMGGPLDRRPVFY